MTFDDGFDDGAFDSTYESARRPRRGVQVMAIFLAVLMVVTGFIAALGIFLG